MKKRLSALFRVLFAFFLISSLSFGALSTPAHASNTAQLDVASIVALANADRAANGAPALTEDTLLDRAAQLKADDMAAKGYFAHVSPSGVTPWDWFKSVQYYYYDAGENLAEGFADATSLETAWMHSPTHRANLLNAVYSRVGIGIAEGMYQGRPTIFVAQEFANPYIAPVAVKAPVAKKVAVSTTRKYAVVPKRTTVTKKVALR